MPTLMNKYYPVRTIVFFLGEGILIFSSLMVVDWAILGSGLFFLDIFPNALRAYLVTSIFQLCLYFFDQYDFRNEILAPQFIHQNDPGIRGGLYSTQCDLLFAAIAR